MMKCKKVVLLCISLLLCLSTLYSVASASNEKSQRIDYADGSYAIISINTTALPRSQANETKTYTFYNSARQKCFSYTLIATFSYTGISSNAEDVDFDAAIYHKDWDIDSHDEWTSGSSAYGEAVFIGPDSTEREVSLSLTCDADGNVT